MTELKPCPFCGKTPVLSGDKKIRWIVCPSDSPCSGSGMAMGIAADDVERGIEAWNTRHVTSLADAQAEIARLRGALEKTARALELAAPFADGCHIDDSLDIECGLNTAREALK